jgi:hypothetical protein
VCNHETMKGAVDAAGRSLGAILPTQERLHTANRPPASLSTAVTLFTVMVALTMAPTMTPTYSASPPPPAWRSAPRTARAQWWVRRVPYLANIMQSSTGGG